MAAYPKVKFLTSAQRAAQFPDDGGVEVAVAGRSNAGKSSAINVITGRKGLARTSKTPGATRLVNFFELRPGRRLVDLPGYGFAAVSRDMRAHWGVLVRSYFDQRHSLRGVIVVMDARRPLTDHDLEMLEMAGAAGVPMHLLLTKADKLGRGAAKQSLISVQRAVGDAATAQLFSALKGDGLAEARGALESLLEGRGKKETPAEPADPAGVSVPGVGG
jgi:GTP-binding protein